MPSITKDNNTKCIEYSTRWARSGFLVFALEYRLWYPQTDPIKRQRIINDPIADVQTAIKWVNVNAEAFDGDLAGGIGITGCSAGALTVTNVNMFGFDPDVDFDYVISVSGGVLPNFTSPWYYLWPTINNAATIRPQLSIVAEDDHANSDPAAREIATAAFFESNGVPHHLILLAGDEHCPSPDASDDNGGEIFMSMLAFALNHTHNVHCVPVTGVDVVDTVGWYATVCILVSVSLAVLAASLMFIMLSCRKPFS
jgi:hypothetical protein